ncbi:MAG TPA: nucleotidyltransferase family protein [Longimicrobium sp.]|jgi:hypothetical protein|uniref:nucleotidyltransferase family protein n=1 Tax=Longimicrobium sp. TaxID=2029185 RepID=UPI002ED78F28
MATEAAAPLAEGTKPPLPARQRCAEALVLRRWALHVLWDAPVPPALAAAAEACSPGGWALFLGMERCALPLGRAVRPGQVPPHGAAVLEASTLRELQRVLGARAQLRTFAAAAAERGWTVVVLKGGAAVAGGSPPLDLVDVDVLVPRDTAGEVAGFLEGRGYDRHGHDPGVNSASFWHLAARTAPGALMVEVHFTVQGFEPIEETIARAVPLPERPLLRMAPADELWHLLLHGVSHHLNRRGNLRELQLMKAALARCAPADRADVGARVAAHRDAPAMRAVLRMAEWPNGTAPADPFASMAAGGYLAGASRALFASRVLWSDLVDALSALLARDGATRRLWATVPARPDVESAHPAIARLERAAPPVGRAARVLQRVVRLSASFARAVPMAVRARRLADASAPPSS